MRVMIDAHAIGSRLTGNETYMRNLLDAMARQDRQSEFLLLFSHAEAREAWEGRYPNFRTFLVPPQPIKRLVWGLAERVRRERPDLLHVQYTAPLACPVPVVTTTHDISFEHFPGYFTRRERAQFRLTIPWTARRAAQVLTVSEYSRQDLIRTYGLAPERVTLTPNGIASHFQPASPTAIAEVRARYAIEGPYVLAVGNLQPRKNLPALVQAFERMLGRHPEWPHRLVIVGKKAWLFDGILAEIARAGVRDRIVMTDYVPEADLPALYSGAACFVYPSLFEGFGLPPLEAMACGTPVVVGDNSALPEVVGEAGLRVEATSLEAIEQAMERLLLDEVLRRRLAEAGRVQAARFTWDECARRTLEVYRAVTERGVRR